MSSDRKKDLGMRAREDTLKGKMKRFAGRIQSKFGQVTGNKEAKAKGRAKEAEGTVQAAKGQVEGKVDDALKRLRPKG